MIIYQQFSTERLKRLANWFSRQRITQSETLIHQKEQTHCHSIYCASI